MIRADLAALNEAVLSSLIANGVPESLTLEYKQALPEENDEGRREFLADVSQFANSNGGDVVYGVAEQRDSTGRPTGVPESIVGVKGVDDALLTALHSRIRDGVQPRLPGVEMRIIPTSGGQVLVVRIAQSWVMPHMVTYKNLSRFFGRRGAAKYQMNVDDLRAAFTRGDTLRRRVSEFRMERTAMLANGERSVHPPMVVLHVMPASAAAGQLIDQESLVSFRGKILTMAGGGSWGWNLDGPVITAGGPSDGLHGYCQVFRDGSIESVAGAIGGHPKSDPILHIPAMEMWVMDALKQYLSASAEAGVEPPFWVMLTFLGVKGFYAPVMHRNPQPIDRDVLRLPEVLYNDRTAKLEAIVRPMFDALWQAAGLEGSPNFGDNGLWRRPR